MSGADREDARASGFERVGDLVGGARRAGEERAGSRAAAEHGAERAPAGRDDDVRRRRTQTVAVREHDEGTRRGSADHPRRAQGRSGWFPQYLYWFSLQFLDAVD